MNDFSSPVTNLIDELSRLPGIGRKSAQRLALHIIEMPVEETEQLASAIVEARRKVCYCKVCSCLSDGDICPICQDPTRDHSTIMVVEGDREKAAYERTGRFKGVYHVLQGALSPMAGISADKLKIKELLEGKLFVNRVCSIQRSAVGTLYTKNSRAQIFVQRMILQCVQIVQPDI